MKIDFSRMTLDDVDKIAELDKKCFPIPWSRAAFADELINDMTYYVTAKDGDIYVGYAGLWNIAGEGDITNIAVIPEYRRQGIGTALLNRMLRYANEQRLSRLTLEVRKSNHAAIGLYKNFGFEIIGERKNYYSDNREDAHIMAVVLQ